MPANASSFSFFFFFCCVSCQKHHTDEHGQRDREDHYFCHVLICSIGLFRRMRLPETSEMIRVCSASLASSLSVVLHHMVDVLFWGRPYMVSWRVQEMSRDSTSFHLSRDLYVSPPSEPNQSREKGIDWILKSQRSQPCSEVVIKHVHRQAQQRLRPLLP